MTKIEFEGMCRAWLHDSNKLTRTLAFPSVLTAASKALDVLPLTLAKEFEVTHTTVLRWMQGTARPHPLIQKQVIENLLLRAQRE